MADKGYTQTISTAGFGETPTLVLEQPTGDVRVEGWDRQEIQISVTDEGIFEVEQSGSQVVVRNRPGKFKLVDFLEPASNELREYGLDLSKAASRVERSVERKMRDVRKMGRNINIDIDLSNWKGGRDYNIMVPHSCNLNLRTSSGDLEVVGVGGTLSFQSSSGDISARIISGNALVVTASGDITIDDLDGKLAVRTASGDLHTQTLGLRELSAATASGDLELDLTRLPDGNCEIRTISGDLNIFLPPTAAFRAEVHTLSGSVRTGFPRDVVEYTSTHKRETVLNVNGGGKTIQLNTVSGDVSIRERKRETQPTAGYTNQAPYRPATGLSYPWTPETPTSAGGAPTMDLTRTHSQHAGHGEHTEHDESHGDITQSEGYAARQQAELEILELVAKGDLSTEDALARLAALDGEAQA